MPRLRTLACLLALLPAGAGCSSTAPERTTMDLDVKTHAWHDRQHHTDDGFTNIWYAPRDVSGWKAARWMLGRAFDGKVNEAAPVRPVDPAVLRVRPERLRLTWLGHAATLVQTPALDILLDPMLGERASPLSFAGPTREAPLPLDPAELPGVDVVLLSHNHYDHLDEGSIRQLEADFSPLFLVPLGVGPTLRGWGAERVAELDWWQYVDVGGLRFHCTPARHFSSRSLFDRDRTLWAGWYLEGTGDDAPTLYFAGDTGYAPFFTEIRDRLGAPEVALLPIGAYLPRWFMAPVHVDPDEAVKAFLDLQAGHFVPIHWGVFDLADEALQDPPQQLRDHAEAAGITDRLHLLDIGGVLSFEGAGSPPVPEGGDAAAGPHR